MKTAMNEAERKCPLADTIQAAEYLGCSRATVYSEMNKGRLKWCKVAGCRKIEWAELEAYIQRNSFGGNEV